MKKILLISAALMLAHAAFSQGTVVFGNRGAGTSTAAAPGNVLAPVYGLAADNSRISGNTATGVPMGSTAYAGIPFLASDPTHTFSATLWAIDASLATGNALNNNLQQATINGVPASATFRTSTSGTFAGIWNQPVPPAAIAGVGLETQRATFQVRVWDTSKAATWDLAQITPGSIFGYSDLFTVPYALGGTAVPQNVPPYLQGLQSFNVQAVVPEPSVIALGVLGAGCLFLLRRRK